MPYRGGGPLLTDLVGGQIDFNFGQVSTYLGAVRNKQLRALAIMAKERWPARARNPHRGRRGSAGTLWIVLAWHVGAQGNAEGRYR